MFQPYTGQWTFDEAAHLLRRTIFGPTKARILQAVDDGMEATISALLSPPPVVAPPIYYDFDQDPEADIGFTWVDKELDGDITGIYFARSKTLWAWWFMQMNRNDQTITEKLTLFWHNHFVISDAGHANMNWQYINLLRDFGLGDFKEMTKRMTVDRSMLIYLNGKDNIAAEPNENYARELLELFTIGKGEQIAPGDYTTYTEHDIAEIARALTGWVPWTPTNDVASFKTWRHDTGTKTLSTKFGSQQINDEGEEEYKTVIDIIFQQDEVARHISRRLYMWFVHYDINETIEQEIIEPMAQLILDNDYVIKPALEALLKSEHFYDTCVRGSMIKSPLDFFFSSYNGFEVEPHPDILVEYQTWVAWYWQFQKQQMAIFEVPSVAGWKAYHQSPIFYRDWINSASLALRRRMMKDIRWLTQYINADSKGYDFVKFIESLDNPLNVNDLIDEVCKLFFTRPMTQEQKDFFKEALIPGLPDFEWTTEYQDYLTAPTDSKRQALENKLWDFFHTIMGVPEFHLS